MSHLPLRLFLAPEFQVWRSSLDRRSRDRVSARLKRLAWGHFGDSKSLGGGVFELRWHNGMRVYYTRRRVGDFDTLVLHGGFKGTQYGDIEKARALQTRYEEISGSGSGGADA